MKNIWSLAHLKFSLKFFAQFNWRDNIPLIVAAALSMQGIAWYMLPNSKIIFRKMIDATLFVAYKTSSVSLLIRQIKCHLLFESKTICA